MKSTVAFDVATTGSMSYLDVRDQLPSIDPENLSPQDVLTILLHLFQQQPGFVDRGHEVNNKETAWVPYIYFVVIATNVHFATQRSAVRLRAWNGA